MNKRIRRKGESKREVEGTQGREGERERGMKDTLRITPASTPKPFVPTLAASRMVDFFDTCLVLEMAISRSVEIIGQ